MNSEEKLKRLTEWAQTAHRVEGGPAPFGFSTRVVARWVTDNAQTNLWEWFSVRSVAVAVCIMLATIVVNHDLLSDGFELNVTVADSVEGPLL